MASVFFADDFVTINGARFEILTPYTLTEAGAVRFEMNMNGRRHPVEIPKDNGLFDAARAMVKADADPAPEAAADDNFLTVDAETAEQADMDFLYENAETRPAPKKREQKTRKPAAMDPAKAARGPVPEKAFINTEITGRGWRIFFDREENRTRVIFEKCPTKEVRQIVKDAGFYWSPAMGSWNKKLTFKAYRAALELAKALQDVRRIAA